MGKANKISPKTGERKRKISWSKREYPTDFMFDVAGQRFMYTYAIEYLRNAMSYNLRDNDRLFTPGTVFTNVVERNKDEPKNDFLCRVLGMNDAWQTPYAVLLKPGDYIAALMMLDLTFIQTRHHSQWHIMNLIEKIDEYEYKYLINADDVSKLKAFMEYDHIKNHIANAAQWVVKQFAPKTKKPKQVWRPVSTHHQGKTMLRVKTKQFTTKGFK